MTIGSAGPCPRATEHKHHMPAHTLPCSYWTHFILYVLTNPFSTCTAEPPLSYEDQPAVMSVAAKFKRLHGVTRRTGLKVRGHHSTGLLHAGPRAAGPQAVMGLLWEPAAPTVQIRSTQIDIALAIA